MLVVGGFRRAKPELGSPAGRGRTRGKLRGTARLPHRRRSLRRAFEHEPRLHHVNREAGDEVDEAEHDEQEQGRRRRLRHEHELARHDDEQDEREQMVDDPLAAGPHRFEDLDVEQEYADRDDKIAHGDRQAVVEDQRQGRLGRKGKLEYRALLLIAERHVEEKDGNVEERKWDEQEGESDQVHDGWLSLRRRRKANAHRRSRRDGRSLEYLHRNWNWARRCQAPTIGSRSGLFPRLEDLPAAVHAGLEIDVMRPAQLARILVLDIGRPRQRIGGAAHPPPRRRCFSFRDGHVLYLLVARGRWAQMAARLGVWSRAYRGSRAAKPGPEQAARASLIWAIARRRRAP